MQTGSHTITALSPTIPRARLSLWPVPCSAPSPSTLEHCISDGGPVNKNSSATILETATQSCRKRKQLPHGKALPLACVCPACFRRNSLPRPANRSSPHGRWLKRAGEGEGLADQEISRPLKPTHLMDGRYTSQRMLGSGRGGCAVPQQNYVAVDVVPQHSQLFPVR